MHHLNAGDRVRFSLSDEIYTGTVVEVRPVKPQTYSSIRHVDNAEHVVIDDDRGGRAIVELAAVEKLSIDFRDQGGAVFDADTI